MSVASYDLGFAPRYRLTCNGTVLLSDVTRHIGRVRVELSMDKASMLSVEVSDTPVDGGIGRGGAGGVESAIWAEGNLLEVELGYESQTWEHLGRYQLQAGIPQGDNDGRRLTVVGLDASAKLMAGQLSRRFESGVPYQDVVSTIGHEYGWDVEADEVLPRRAALTKKAGVTDFRLLCQVAAEASNLEGVEFYWQVKFDPKTRRDVLRFKRWTAEDQTDALRFVYYGGGLVQNTLRTWRIIPQLRGTPTKVSLVYLDRTTREEREVIAELRDPDSDPAVIWAGYTGRDQIEQEIRDGACVRLNSIGEFSAVGTRSFASEEEAVRFAKKWFREHQLSFVQGEFSCVGVPFVRPWQLHEFRGMMLRWDGVWLVNEATHTLDGGGGYGLDICATRVPDGDTLPATSSGMWGGR